MNRNLSICLLLAVCLAHGSTDADTLALSRGDTLSGALVEIADGTLAFRTVFAGLTIVPLDEVHWLATDKYFTISLKNGETVPGRFVHKDGATHLVSPDGKTESPIQITDIQKTTLIELKTRIPLQDDAEGGEPSRSASLEFGALRRWANWDYNAAYARLRFENQTDRYYFESSALAELSDEDLFPRLFNALTEWQFAPRRTVHPEIVVGLERDTDRALKLRADIGLGMGGDLIRDGSQRLRWAAGLGAAFEYYDAELLPWAGRSLRLRDIQPSRFIEDVLEGDSRNLKIYCDRLARHGYYDEEQHRREEQEANLYLRLQYKRRLLHFATFSEELRFIPSLTDLGSIRARSESALQFALTSRVTLKLELLVNYENEPEYEALDQWTTAVGAGLAWGF